MCKPWERIGGAEVWLHSFLTLAIHEGGWSNFTPRPLYSREITLVPNEQETGWVFWWREISLFPAGVLTPDHSPLSLVTALNTLSRLPIKTVHKILVGKPEWTRTFMKSRHKWKQRLLGYSAASSGDSLPTFRDNLSVPSLDSWPLNMGPIGCPQSTVRNLMFCWPCIIVYRYNETNVMHFSFSLLRIKNLYMFRALLAHPQEALHKWHLVYCVRMSVGCATVAVKRPLILNKLNEKCITLVSLYRP
jgi:hypothetical protein